MTNFTILDIAGALRAMVGFAAILAAPGYAVAWSLDSFGFRSRTLLERSAWAVALSFCISPITLTLLGRLVPLGACAALFAATGCAAIALAVLGNRSVRLGGNRHTVALAVFVVLGVAAVIGTEVDIQRGNRLHLSVSVLDQAFRVAFVNSIAHSGIPPVNPLYHPGAASPLRYYYFWYALCAVCMKLAHVSARQALIASGCWTGIGLVALQALFARHFLELRTGLHRYILTCSLLLTVTGLDLLPVLYNLFVSHDFGGDLEWWSTDQISSWFDSVVWVPNHVASLLTCLAAFLLLWRTRSAGRRRDRISATALAGVAAASAFGLSVYVAAGFAMMMTGWAIYSMARGRERRTSMRLGVGVVIAALLLVPYLRDLFGAHSGTEGRGNAAASHLLQFSVRKMIDSELITTLPVLARAQHKFPIFLDQFIRLLLLLPGYALELGIYGLVLVLAVRDRRALSEPAHTALGMAIGGLAIVSLVRSSVIGNNDFGYRAAMIPCFFLLLLAADRIVQPGPKPWINLLLFAGLAGTGFQALMLRTYVPLHSGARMPGFDGLPEAAFAARTVYAEAVRQMPANAIVQSNLIDPGNYFYVVNILFSERQMLSDAAVDCGAVFGGDPARCAATQKAIRALFALPALSAAEAASHCRQLGTDYLAVARNDPAWEDRSGWVWTMPLASNGRESLASPDAQFRIVQCGTPLASAP